MLKNKISRDILIDNLKRCEEEAKTERNKDDNTIKFSNKLLEKNVDTEKVIKFVESERDKDRKCQTIKTVCDTVKKILIFGGIFLLVIKILIKIIITINLY